MKIFINYNQHDRKSVEIIKDFLTNAGHEVTVSQIRSRAKENVFEKVADGIRHYDFVMLVISGAALRTEGFMQEISSLILSRMNERSRKILPVLVEKTSVPNYISDYLYVDVSDSKKEGLHHLLREIEGNANLPVEKNDQRRGRKKNHTRHLYALSKALSRGSLTLVCGTGISIGAGVPSWQDLLMRLLQKTIIKLTNNNSAFRNVNLEEFNNKYPASTLMIGKYLRDNLGNDFNKEVRDALYLDNPESCDILEAIVTLSRPQRNGNPLDSIITFNFDGLIEEHLERHNIRFRSIDREGLRSRSDELPIYHVHGYLPRNKRVARNYEIVFSEDTYHSQFLESFSWSNLIQLNKFSKNTCLFIGLSMTDPNLRRLLDVSSRKNPDKMLNHYIIKAMPRTCGEMSPTDELAMFLEEQDFNGLGLNVIWINEFSEIASILNSVFEKAD